MPPRATGPPAAGARIRRPRSPWGRPPDLAGAGRPGRAPSLRLRYECAFFSISILMKSLWAVARHVPPWLRLPAWGRPRVVHPFFFALFPIVSLFAHNVYETPPSELIAPVAVISAVVL